MSTPQRHQSGEDENAEFRRYLVGGAVTLCLTLAAFALVWLAPFDRAVTLTILAVGALVQIAAHFRYFLHIDLQKSHRDDLMLILFTTLIILLMVGGTLWILYNQWSRMGMP